MIAVMDTSSLLSLVKYYLPFDKGDKLFNCFESKVKAGEIIILDEVFEESKYVAGGIIVESLHFMSDKSNRISTKELLPFPKFFNMLEHNFCYGSEKNRLTGPEFEQKKNEYLKGADAKQILFCLENRHNLIPKELVLVTEETNTENDGKLFKKLPAICEIVEVNHYTLPELINSFSEINIKFD